MTQDIEADLNLKTNFFAKKKKWFKCFTVQHKHF